MLGLSWLTELETMNIGLYTAAAWAIPHLTARTRQPDAHPSFFFSNSGLYHYPIADFFSLSMQKAAQFNLAGSLNQVLAPQGVHVGSVDIGGVVTDEDPVLNSRNIAEQFWKLYQQDKEQWMFDVKLGDIQEFIKQMSGQ
jgi:NAD(P)-dependent dehydrogenase (short-subunit alcohol dehydrogenase family)